MQAKTTFSSLPFHRVAKVALILAIALGMAYPDASYAAERGGGLNKPEYTASAPIESPPNNAVEKLTKYVSLDVQKHSASEIKAYIKANRISKTSGMDKGFYIKPETGFTEVPSVKQPYKTGSVQTKYLNEALRALNAARYIAGLDANVALDEEYTALSQMGSLVNAANSKMSHFPSRPSGMSDSMYFQGLTGCGSSNLGMGYRSLIDAIWNGWMEDSDSKNIDRLGHRRWALNPAMGKTSFGFVYDGGKSKYFYWSSMYVKDKSNSNATQTRVAWPAQNMPLEFFSENSAWSLSTGELLNASNISVTLTRISDRKKWSFSEKRSDGVFYVDNALYGQRGCIIFRPNNLKLNDGDRFEVTIEGTSSPIKYTVNFFSTGSYITDVKLEKNTFSYDGKAKKPAVTVLAGNKKLTQGRDFKVVYKNNVNAGTANAKVIGIGSYAGEKSTTYNIKKAKQTISCKNICRRYSKAIINKHDQSLWVKAKTRFNASKSVQALRVSITGKGVTNKPLTKVKVSKNGRITIKKGAPRGLYKIKIRIRANESKNWQTKAIDRVVTVKII